MSDPLPDRVEPMKAVLTEERFSGEEVQRMITAAVATPKDLVNQAKRYIGQ